MIKLTVDQVCKASGATPAVATKYLPYLEGTCQAYGITTPKRISGFLSQIGVESAGLTTLVENLNYSVEALLTKFPRRISEADARKVGRTPYQKANQEGIANLIYGGAWGRKNLGNLNYGDGWLFRGRGLKQLTGRDNYQRCGVALGENFISDPDRLLMPVNAALSAGWFWKTHGLNELADSGKIREITEIVNGGLSALDRRVALFESGLGIFS